MKLALLKLVERWRAQLLASLESAMGQIKDKDKVRETGRSESDKLLAASLNDTDNLYSYQLYYNKVKTIYSFF